MKIKIALLFSMLLASTTIWALETSVFHRTMNGDIVSTKVKSEDNLYDIRKQMRSNGIDENQNPNDEKRMESGEWITLNLKVEYPDSLNLDVIQYGGWYGGQFFFDDERNHEIKADLQYNPSFPHILVATFYSENPENSDLYIIFKELECFENGMEIVFDSKDATDLFKFQYLNMKGEPLSFALTERDPLTKEEKIIGNGDVFTIFSQQNIFYKDLTIYNLYLQRLYDRINSQTREREIMDHPHNLWMNEVPEGIGISCSYIGCSIEPNTYYMGTLPAVNKPGIYKTSIENYVEHSIPVMASEYAIDNMNEGHFEAVIFNTINGVERNGIISSADLYQISNSPMYINIKASLPVPSITGIDILQGWGGIRWIQETPFGEFSTDSPVFITNKRRIEFMPINISETGTSNISGVLFTRDFGNWENTDWNKLINPFITTNPDNYKTIIGNTVPSLSFLGMYYEGNLIPEELFPYLFGIGYFSGGYMGRNNDARLLDSFLTDITEEQSENTYIYTLKVDNTLIDGVIPGGNTTILGCQMYEPDFVPPTLQYLALFDKDGYVNDRFDSIENAWFEFWAGDFFYEVNEDMTEDRMAVRPLESVTVEYAPYGSEDYMPLDVTENPDKFFMPGYGYCFEGSLATVGNTEGWYDMRFSLTDTSGNYQIQTLSPAFYISAQASGINSPSALKGKVNINGNSIIAPDGAEIYSVSGVKSSGKNLLPGVYIVRLGSESIKCIIR